MMHPAATKNAKQTSASLGSVTILIISVSRNSTTYLLSVLDIPVVYTIYIEIVQQNGIF